MKKQILLPAFAAVLALISSPLAPIWAQSSSPVKPLTIEALFAPGGLAGRGPENTEWSPDGTKLSFVERDDEGEHGELWYVDAATGEKKVLVSAAKLASLAPDTNKVKNEREKERRTRYHVAAYLWAPDSKHLIFDSQGQLWVFDLATSTAVQFTSAPDPSGDPKFSPDGSHVSYVRQHNLYVRPASGGGEKQLTKDTGENLFNGDIGRITDIDTDMFPQILAGAVIAASQVATRRWYAADPPVPLRPLIELALRQLATACSRDTP